MFFDYLFDYLTNQKKAKNCKNQKKEKPIVKAQKWLKHWVFLGAANQIRTGDLVLTKDVLCLLSHSSIRKRQDELAFCGDPERARTVDL